MSKIERRHKIIVLHQGGYEQKLADLSEAALAALRAEESGATPRRAGTKSVANQKAREYDALLTEAEETATRVSVWAISNDQYNRLADEHPPRDDDANDKKFGVNLKTFTRDLLLASLVQPDEAAKCDDLASLLEVGKAVLDDLDLSRLHYVKVESGAWSVNVGDDSLPKESLSSILQRLRDLDSKPPSDSE